MDPVLLQIIWLVAAVLICGVVIWGLDQLPAIDATFKQVARIVIVAGLLIWAIVVVVRIATGVRM
jgi:hypothetical protein